MQHVPRCEKQIASIHHSVRYASPSKEAGLNARRVRVQAELDLVKRMLASMQSKRLGMKV
jgi:hypothetical protein